MRLAAGDERWGVSEISWCGIRSEAGDYARPSEYMNGLRSIIGRRRHPASAVAGSGQMQADKEVGDP